MIWTAYDDSPVNDFLFVCSANWQRSPTCEHVARLKKLSADSAGTDLGAVRPLTPAAIGRAKRLVAMEPEHARVLAKMAPGRVQDVECWDIPDVYEYCSKSLISLVKVRLVTPKEELLWRT